MLIEGFVAIFFCTIAINKLFNGLTKDKYGTVAGSGIYYIKWIIVYTFYRVKNWKWKVRPVKDTGSDLRFLPANDISRIRNDSSTPWTKESFRSLEDSEAVDSLYFNAFGDERGPSTDNNSFAIRLTRSDKNIVEICFQIYVPHIGILEHPFHHKRVICSPLEDEDVIKAKGIKIELLEPMRRWRISYNGFMTLTKTGSPDTDCPSQTVHVKLALIWNNFTPPIDIQLPPSLLASVYAKQQWNWEFYKHFRTNCYQGAKYHQWGQYIGNIYVENYGSKTLLLRGVKARKFEKSKRDLVIPQQKCFMHLADGTSIFAALSDGDDDNMIAKYGYIVQPNRRINGISRMEMRKKQPHELNADEEYDMNLVAGNRSYAGNCKSGKSSTTQRRKEQRKGANFESFIDLSLNGISGQGVIEFNSIQSDKTRNGPEISNSCRSKVFDVGQTDLVLEFCDEKCQNTSVVGGKGAQLAKLTDFFKGMKNIQVPIGFCITSYAFTEHIKNNPKIKGILQKISNVTCEQKDELKSLCNAAGDEICNSTLDKMLETAIREAYKKLQPDRVSQVAIRSSAIGEDSEDLSAAGQLESFLGVVGNKEIVQSVKKSWCSLYSYRAVSYRKEHGQSTICSMGVVIQVMVSNSQASGVLFTQHPVTGHPGQVVINANHGLGETVVDGTVDPDTILVSVLPQRRPKIISRIKGNKDKKAVCDDSGGVTTIPNMSVNEICINDEIAIFLARIGKDIERYFGDPRDIEWAVTLSGEESGSDQIHVSILQARPVTTEFTETEHEILHEFDSAFPSYDFQHTSSNISEMMNGPMTPLTSSCFHRAASFGTENLYLSTNARPALPHCNIYTSQCMGHIFLNYKEMLSINKGVNIGSHKDSIDLNIFGKVSSLVTEEEALRYHDNFVALPWRIWNTLKFWKTMFLADRNYRKAIEVEKNMHMDGTTCKEIYRGISDNLQHYMEMWKLYLLTASMSGVANRVLMEILTQGTKEWKTAHYSDVAMIYGTSDKELSHNPSAYLNKVAESIYNSKYKTKFLTLNSEEAISWLLESETEAGHLFSQFLRDCGHRGMNEPEFRERTWGSYPQKLGDSLQAMVSSYSSQPSKTKLTVDETIQKLQTPVSFTGKLFLRWAIPNARQSLAGRERGKSAIVHTIQKFKTAYHKLGQKMQLEGYIPNPDLMYFLTHGEIGKLLHTRSSQLIRRANRRKRLHNIKEKTNFPEFSERVPMEPITCNEAASNTETSLLIQGCPVGHGRTEGKARVLWSKDQASDIQHGEILIIRTTDVGWTPYFPLLSGLATEIGGIISHGAVVAREYGLPCIVGAKEATRIIKTGDLVELDGEKGTLRKICTGDNTENDNNNEPSYNNNFTVAFSNQDKVNQEMLAA